MNNSRILIAEDETVLRFLLTETLEEEGWEIDEAEDGRAAMDSLRHGEYDLAILDYMMPEATGIEVCEWLRAEGGRNADKPVILLTAKAGEKDKARALAAGVSLFVAKPFSPDELTESVRGLLAGGRS
ncbi:response regulator transcription factor [Saccharibacillus sp. CPCC 101409]|uniref:response regulator transcription factor n=1 Tax=Saccharibacillus sp. CPCC 101409 TaxID=3058041 RepID=UPI0026729D32|nr:response regulator transcription factor [Saccharibacillus sp. CPCC 101409]MDO3411377.1 response regulator transcription factor [Saccharibacillus sp. CPCC 101409]